jgi:hypothetical protein
LLRSAGFTLKDFVPTVWELIPLSYVADWFFNIGAVLDAWAFNQSQISWQCMTYKNRVTAKYSGKVKIAPTPGTPGQFTIYQGDPGSVILSRIDLERRLPGTATLRQAFRLPDMFLFSKLCNVTSLLVQARTSSKQVARLLNG